MASSQSDLAQMLEKNRALLEMHMNKHASKWKTTGVVPEPDGKVAKVFLRTRPLLRHEEGALCLLWFPPIKNQIHVVTPTNRWSGGRFATKAFAADGVFDMSTTNEEVYKGMEIEKCVEELMSVPEDGKGCDNLVVAYGQTGTGKTFTMTAIEELVMASVFKASAAHSGSKISVSAFELRQDGQNHAFDLLSTPPLHPVKVIGSDGSDETAYVDLSSHVVESEQELKDLIHAAASERKTRSTVKNDTSSRSHAVVRLTVLHPFEGTHGVFSRFTMIDLAGFERSEYLTRNTSPQRIKESIETNKSLAALKDCIRSRLLAKENKNIHVPWRNSKLTIVLRSVFERSTKRKSRLVILGCISPNGEDLDDTLNTLKYVTPFRLSAEASIDEGKENAVRAGDSVDPEDPRLWPRQRCLQWIQGQVPRLSPFSERLFPEKSSTVGMRSLWSKSTSDILTICSTPPNPDEMTKEALENDKKATAEALRLLKPQIHAYQTKLYRLRQKWQLVSANKKAVLIELGGRGGKSREVGEVTRTDLEGKISHVYDHVEQV